MEAAISKAKADIEASSAKIEDLSAAISADEKELAEATAVREKDPILAIIFRKRWNRTTKGILGENGRNLKT